MFIRLFLRKWHETRQEQSQRDFGEVYNSCSSSRPKNPSLMHFLLRLTTVEPCRSVFHRCCIHKAEQLRAQWKKPPGVDHAQYCVAFIILTSGLCDSCSSQSNFSGT